MICRVAGTLPVIVVAAGVELGDLHVGELREILRQRVVDQQLAALVKLQRRERDHRLGHRGDVEDRVLRHRDAGRLVAEAERLEVDELALAGDRDHGAGQAALLDVGIDDLRDLAEPLGRHADVFGLGARQRIAVLARSRPHLPVYWFDMV